MAEEEVTGEVLRGGVFRDVFDGLGWSRFVPHAAVEVLGVVVLLGAPTREQVGRLVGRTPDAVVGLSGPAWDEFEPWTEHTLRTALDGAAPTPGEVARANAEDRAWLDGLIAEVDAYADALGVFRPRTLSDVLDYLAACTVLIATGRDEDTRYELNPWAMLPAEVLPLTREQADEEDLLRWIGLHRPVVRKLIDLFGPYADAPLDVLRTTLLELSRTCGVDLESIRAAVTILADQPDFEVTGDAERAEPGAELEIRVDWANFLEYRLDIAAGTIDSP
ncbi:DUF6042 family protein [Actinokineospora sp. PR83]|uniref:DUF6042 family protein n=1 Tax=Actinokineospora sp. PR83 TaxID=2884908 RepID=UPI001F22EA7B|nr:DUF6042 family protein [Actinokineospora sp. PR83]MCG8914931.1 DUF6042 family protein [Actinokineospora sp. PR83]